MLWSISSLFLRLRTRRIAGDRASVDIFNALLHDTLSTNSTRPQPRCNTVVLHPPAASGRLLCWPRVAAPHGDVRGTAAAPRGRLQFCESQRESSRTHQPFLNSNLEPGVISRMLCLLIPSTPLMFSVCECHMAISRLLLAAKADAVARNISSDGRLECVYKATCWHAACGLKLRAKRVSCERKPATCCR